LIQSIYGPGSGEAGEVDLAGGHGGIEAAVGDEVVAV
jgi:hypothetical protein